MNSMVRRDDINGFKGGPVGSQETFLTQPSYLFFKEIELLELKALMRKACFYT